MTVIQLIKYQLKFFLGDVRQSPKEKIDNFILQHSQGRRKIIQW